MSERRDESNPGIEVPEARPPEVSSEGENEERFRALTEHVRDAIIELDPQGGLLYLSPAFTEHFGWRSDDVAGKKLFDWVHPADQSGVESVWATCFAENSSFRARFRLQLRDESWQWVELAGRPYRKSTGEARAVATLRYVSDEVFGERALQEQLEVERRIADLSRRFLTASPDDFGERLSEGLAAAAGIAGADRARLLILKRSGRGVESEVAWQAEGIEPRQYPELEEAVAGYPWSAAIMLRGDDVHVPRLEDLPGEAGAERRSMEARGIRSYLGLPLIHDGRPLGFLNFYRLREERGWSERDRMRLGLLVEVLSTAVRGVQGERIRLAAEGRFRTLTEQTQDTICEMSLRGRVLYISDNFKRLCGYSPSELRGIDPWELIHPDDFEALRSDASQAVRRGNGRITYRIRHADGRWRWLESTVNSFSNSAGERRLAVVSRDVTEVQRHRIELERQLEVETRVAEFSRALLETGSDAIDLGIQRVLESVAGLAGAERAFLVSTHGLERTDFAWHAPGASARSDALGGPGPCREWMLPQLRDGKVVSIARGSALPDEARTVRESLARDGIRSYLCIPINSGRRLLAVMSFHCLREEHEWSRREITLLRLVLEVLNSALRRRRAETRLAESQYRLLQAQKMEAIGTLAGGIAHDFNNQLTVMLANSRFAMGEVAGNTAVEEALEDLHRAGEHCAQLTRSLLAFSRQTPAEPQLLEAGAVAAEAEELLRPLIPGSIRFELQVEDPNARVVADPTQLQQVLINLVVNARDAMQERGQLWLRVRERVVQADELSRLGLSSPGRYVEFVVRDTGTGMDADTRERIFEPFFTTKPVGEGTGLGLATAYAIVERCGGSISIESELGRGSEFRVLIPASLETSTAVELAEEVKPVGAEGTLLLVEDEESVRKVVARMARAAGYTVIEAADGAEALRLGRQNRLDLLVADIDIPRLDGVELARRLTRERSDLGVLYISGNSLEDLGLPAPDAAMRRTRFLAKPFGERSLLEALQELRAD